MYGYDTKGQVISAKKYFADNTAVPGQQFEFDFDDIGNRKTARAGSGSLRTANYSANNLDQITSRDVPRALDLFGVANANATVTVNGCATTRHGDYYYRELPISETGASLVSVNVTSTLTGTTPVTKMGTNFVSGTPESFTYDLDGNILTDGQWEYTWDSENRLVQMDDGGSAFRLTFEYDYRGRRVTKKVGRATFFL